MHLKTYYSLGVKSDGDTEQEQICTCRFCDSKKFYIDKEEGKFDCKVCGKHGNKYSFMQLLYDECFSDTQDKDYEALSKLRDKLPVEAFINAELAYDRKRKTWLIPVRNDVGSITNLRQWSEGILKHTASCSASLYNADRIGSAKKVFICEGEWDCIALEWFLLENEVYDVAVVACPGASTFKEEWCPIFAQKHITLLYDNDEAGRDGCERTLRILRSSSRVASISRLGWPENTPDKYDVRDYITSNLKRPERAWIELNNRISLIGINATPKEKLVRIKFEEVVADYEKHIFLPEDVKRGLLLEFSILFSNRMVGDPLWMFLIGPPGSGKTLLLQSISDTEHSVYQSSLGAKSLVSGFKMHDGSDPSLVPKIIGKTLIIKEYTEVMALSGTEQDQIFGVLRGAYDGRIERDYAHGISRVYPEPGSEHRTCHFSILAGVTNAIHGNNRASLGERFLKYQMFPEDYDPIAQIRSAIDNAIRQELPEFELRACASAFIEHKMQQEFIPPKVPQWIQDRVIGLSQVVSIIRATVARSHGEMSYRPSPEIGTRLSKQLIKLGQCVAFTLDKSEVDEESYEVMQRVALDTCYGWHRDVVLATANQYPNGILKADICKNAIIGSGTTAKCLEDLYELRALEYDLLQTGKLGQPPKLWRLTPQMIELLSIAKLLKEKVELPDVPKESRIQKTQRGFSRTSSIA